MWERGVSLLSSAAMLSISGCVRGRVGVIAKQIIWKVSSKQCKLQGRERVGHAFRGNTTVVPHCISHDVHHVKQYPRREC